MKRIGQLFDAIADCRTLTAAAWRAGQGKRDRPEVRAFFADLDAQTARLSRELRAGTFRYGAYGCFRIRDPKSRTIHAPPFRDRVAHHALVAATGPAFERGAILHTYACRPGRGQHAALRQARQWTRRSGWFLKIDVAKFYDSIDRAILRGMPDRRFRERRLLGLFDRLLDSYSTEDGKGLPIGALTSQYLGNFYLDGVDHWIEQDLSGVAEFVRISSPANPCRNGRNSHEFRYLRYMDDMLLFGQHDALLLARDAIADRLADLGLAMNANGVPLQSEGFEEPWKPGPHPFEKTLKGFHNVRKIR